MSYTPFSVHRPILQSDLQSCLCAVETSVKVVSSRGGGPVRVWMGHLACVTSTVRLCSAATEALNKSQREPFRFSSPLLDAYSLCLTRDRMTARSPRLAFNHIQIACYVRFNFLRILPRIPSDGFKAGLQDAEVDSDKAVERGSRLA